ncbi:MAG: DinB family protein [Acidobacteria bacterium]|nr:DinB family protein [Acidobacteriota bacterium]
MPILEPVSGGPEPWLAGRHAALAPVPRLLCCSLELSLTDLEKWTAPLSDAELWADPFGAGSVGFHLRHLAGSTERLLTYATDGSVSADQIAFMKAESVPGAPVRELLDGVRASYEAAAVFAAALDPAGLDAPRYIGRARLETVLGVLLAHIAEHAQRHTGQAIVAAKAATTPGRAPLPG